MPVTPSPTRYACVEDLIVAWLKTLGYDQATNELPTNLVDLARTGPVVTVERIGGNDSQITLDVARLDIDVYASSRDAARDHAETIRAAMRTRLVRYVHGGAVVAKVETVSAPSRLPYDSRNVIRRFGATYQVVCHQFGGVA